MRRITVFSVLFAIFLTFTFTGCSMLGSNDSPKEEQPPSEKKEEVPELSLDFTSIFFDQSEVVDTNEDEYPMFVDLDRIVLSEEQNGKVAKNHSVDIYGVTDYDFHLRESDRWDASFTYYTARTSDGGEIELKGVQIYFFNEARDDSSRWAIIKQEKDVSFAKDEIDEIGEFLEEHDVDG